MLQKLLYFYYKIFLTPEFLLDKYEGEMLDFAIKIIKRKQQKKTVSFFLPPPRVYARDYAYERKKEIFDMMKERAIKNSPRAYVIAYTPKDFAYVHETRS